MSKHGAWILLAVLLCATAAEAGWLGGDSYSKKLPKPISLVEIKRWDVKRLSRPSKVAWSKVTDPRWGALGPSFRRAWNLHISHYQLTD